MLKILFSMLFFVSFSAYAGQADNFRKISLDREKKEEHLKEKEAHERKLNALWKDIYNKTQLLDKAVLSNEDILDLVCYKSRRDANISLLKSYPVKEDKNVAIQIFEVDEVKYKLKITKLDNEKLRVSLLDYKDDASYGSYLVIHKLLSFHEDMLETQKAATMFNISELGELSCYYGSHNYFARLEGKANISMHYSVAFLAPDVNFTPQYESKFYSPMREGSKVVAMHNKFKNINGKYSLREDHMKTFFTWRDGENKDLTMVGHKNIATKYAIAPLGHLHYELKSNDVQIMGGFVNQCITNTIFSLSRALISSKYNELKVSLPKDYAFYQRIGMETPGIDINLNIWRWTSLYFQAPMSELIEQESKLEKYKKRWKEYLELMSENEIEVLFDSEKSITAKPTLRLILLE